MKVTPPYKSKCVETQGVFKRRLKGFCSAGDMRLARISSKSIHRVYSVNRPPLLQRRFLSSSDDNGATTKSELLERIMEWRKSFLATTGTNPNQQDIINDPIGKDLLQKFQQMEAAEAKQSIDDVLTDEVRAKKANLTAELGRWRQTFEENHGRKATRNDLFEDPVASKLFEEYQQITLLDWPDDMKLLLTTKLE